MSNSEAYSTLEVRNSSQLPEVVDPEQFQKEFVGQQPQQYAANGTYPPAEGYYAHGVPIAGGLQSPNSQYDATSYQSSPSGMYDANNAKMGYMQNGQPVPPTDGTDEKKEKRKICGVAPMLFYIILGVILVVIVAAVVGGVVGSQASKNSSSTSSDESNNGSAEGNTDSGSGDSNNSTTTTGPPVILSNSRLTSTNWTDGDGVVHRTVFFQDAYDYLIACEWDSDGNTWAQTNITDSLSASTSPIYAMSGSPLAAAAIDDADNNAFEVHLWYLNSSSYIKSVARIPATDDDGRFKIDSLSDADLETRPGSLLAATWQRPSTNDSLGNWIVAYQRPSDGAVKTANSSHWTVSDEAVPGDTVVNNSSLAIIPQRRGTWLDSVQLISEGLGDSGNSMQLSTNDDGWDLNERDILATDIPDPSPTQHFAVTQWDNWSNYLYVALLDGGDLKGNHFDGGAFNGIEDFNFSGGPDRNFTAISMTTDGMLYAISNDEVLEYSVDTSFPSNLRYVGKVFSATDDDDE